MRAIERILAGALALALLAVAERRARRPARRGRSGDAEPVGDPQRPDRAAHRRRALADLLRQDRRGRNACAGRRIEPRRADLDPAPRRLCGACGVRAGERDAGALTLGPEVRTEKLAIAAGGLKIGGILGDAPIDPSKLSLAIYVPVGRNPQGKLVYAKARAGDIVGLPEGAYHIVSTYLDTDRRTVSRQRHPAKHRQIVGARSVDDASVELDRQRRHQGDVRQTHRRDAAPPLRHADA